jgi:integrase
LRELGKTERSRRQVPLSSRALAALDGLPVRLDTPFLFPAPSGGLLEYHNWYRREWRPALEGSGVRRGDRTTCARRLFRTPSPPA